MKIKQYLTDGAYAEVAGYDSVALTAENGVEATDTVFLDREAFLMLCDFLRSNLGWEPK